MAPSLPPDAAPEPPAPSREWAEAAEAARGGGTVLLVGATDRGKSTLARWLVAELARTGMRTGWVDGDVGQPSLGPPGTQSLALVEGPRDGTPAPEAVFFVGNTSPRGHMLPVVVGLHRLRDLARQRGARVAVVDTTGLVSEAAGGGALKRWKIELLQPEVVVAVEREGELGHFLDPVRREGRFRVLSLAPAAGVRPRSPEERAGRRQELFRRSFRGAGLLAVPPSIPVHGGGRLYPGRLLAFQDGNGLVLALGVLQAAQARGLGVLTALRGLSSVASIALGALGIDPETGGETPAG